MLLWALFCGRVLDSPQSSALNQGVKPFVSKWFHEVWECERRAAFSANIRRVEFGGCGINYVDTAKLPAQTQVRAAIMMDLLKSIRTDADTLDSIHNGLQAVAICSALDEAVPTGTRQIVQI